VDIFKTIKIMHM